MTLPLDDIPLSGYSPTELRLLKRRIEAMLPADPTSTDLYDLNLQQELATAFQNAKDMLKAENDAPLNQKAQTTNTITSILKQLAELQKSHFSAARLQRFEQVAAKVFQAHPELYQQYINELNQ